MDSNNIRLRQSQKFERRDVENLSSKGFIYEQIMENTSKPGGETFKDIQVQLPSGKKGKAI